MSERLSPDQPPEVLVTRPSHGVAMVRLNRPEATNALSLPLQAQLSSAFDALSSDEGVRAIVLTGGERPVEHHGLGISGKVVVRHGQYTVYKYSILASYHPMMTGGEQVFAAGGDIKGLIDAGPIDILKRHTERVWAPIERCPKPIVAAVCGYAFGGGAELAMHCDIIIAGRGASFAQPEIRIGIMPGIGGTQRLVRAVGKFNAMRMLLTGRPVGAEEARLMGLVSLVVDDDQVVGEALAMAAAIAAMPALAAMQIKEVVLAGLDASLEAALMLERKANQLLFATRDQKEGMQAFVEKRKPNFEGR